MKLRMPYAEYHDKVLGGWLGKSLGGVVGAPLENHKQWNRMTLETLWPNKLMPNDDLDIQIVWLEAMQERGIHLTSRDLAEYWQDRCWYNFCEYGFFLYNVQRGIAPPLSGTWNNDFFRESEGCPIRSEIWGLVAPGDPELAAELAKRDGQLDHGGISVQIEQFNAAAVAQAIVTDSLARILDAALSVVPADGVVAASVPCVRRICRQYPDPHRAWRLVLREYGDRDASKAITNHALVLMALFLGELDFKKTMLLCVNSGWDTDCTAATTGALLGTLGGTRSLPADWIEKLGKNLFCEIAVKHKNVALTELTDDTCRIGLEMATLRNRRVELTGAPEITVRPPPPPAVSIEVEYPQEPVLWNARPTPVRLVVENPTTASSQGDLVLTASAGARYDVPETSLTVPAHGRQEVVVTIRRDEIGSWLKDKNLFEARWMEGGKELARCPFGLGGARQWLVYGPYWDMWDKTRHPICPYNNDRIISFPSGGDSYNQYAKLDMAYLDEARLLREDIPEEDSLLLERGEDLITEKHLGGFKGQACYYFVRTFRSTKAPVNAGLLLGRTGPFRAWLDGIAVGVDANVRGWAVWDGVGSGRLTGEPQRLVIKLVRLGDHMSLSAIFTGGGDPNKKKGISDVLDCLEDLPPRR